MECFSFFLLRHEKKGVQCTWEYVTSVLKLATRPFFRAMCVCVCVAIFLVFIRILTWRFGAV